jgi:hypothetical protein
MITAYRGNMRPERAAVFVGMPGMIRNAAGEINPCAGSRDGKG